MTISQLPPLPPVDGSITVIPGFVDFQAAHNPDKPWAIFPSSASPTGLESVSYKEFSDATHRVAHMVRPGREGKEGEVVAIVIHTDAMLYMALWAGMMRAGLVPFPMSPRNSALAIVNMMEKTNCHRLIAQSSLASLIGEVQSELNRKNYALRVDELPGLYDVFPGVRAKNRTSTHDARTAVEPYPPSKLPFNEDDVVTYLHSSGSTGFPKPIPFTDKIYRSWCYNADNMYGSRKRQVQWGAMALPTFHAMAFAMQFVTPLLTSCPVALYEPQWPAQPVVPSPQNVLETSRLTGCTGLPVVPSMIEAWVHEEAAIRYLASLKTVLFAGGPLSKKTGDMLVKAGVKLTSVYGATEIGVPVLVFHPERPEDAPYDTGAPEDWEWFQIAPWSSVRWIPQGDGSYELQILTSDTYPLAVENLPDVKGYATSDLFVPHPTKPGLWKITGRADDVITLSSGEKIVPIQQEGHIGTNLMVKGAMMFGRGREQAGVLIELHDQCAFDSKDEKALVEFRNKIWPTIEEANRIGPTFARIFKEMIIVTPLSKPFPRVAKGTIARKQALVEFTDEIDELYENVSHSSGVKDMVPPKSWSGKDVEEWLMENACAVLDRRPLDPSRDLFEQGFDSLSATFMRNRVIGALRSSTGGSGQEAAANVPQGFIFNYRTIHDLRDAICTLIDPTSRGLASAELSHQIQAMIDKYGSDVPTFKQPGKPLQSSAFVLLTGSTGNIGSHILAALLADARVAKVYALNRGSSDADIAERQRLAFEDRGLPVELLKGSKFIPFAGNLSLDRYDLTQSMYDELRSNVTHIIHNAWIVHFSHPLSTFESNIAGTRCLVDFCASVDRPVKLLYTSSIGVAQRWDSSKGPVPEEPLTNPEVISPSGYSASKYIAEQLLARVSATGLQATSLRVGQVSGSKHTGAWNTSDWLPILVKSSVTIGCLPSMEGVTTWIPMDTVASITVDLMFTDDSPPVVNVLHPRPIPWNTIMGYINSALGVQLPLVPMELWMDKIETLASDLQSQEYLDKVPALKLLDFYRVMTLGSKSASSASVEAGGLPLFETSKLKGCSETVRNLEPIDKSHAEMWVKYWRSKGFM